jgi:hypothetical protein
MGLERESLNHTGTGTLYFLANLLFVLCFIVATCGRDAEARQNMFCFCGGAQRRVLKYSSREV